MATLAILLLPTACASTGDRAVTVYGARFYDEHLFDDILAFNARDARDSYIGAGAVSQVIKRYGETARWEVEGQVVKHWGLQDHVELNALAILRWTRFPWNEWMRTSFAVGDGLSYAAEVPTLEDQDDGTRWLNYLLIEVTLGLPRSENWSVVGRIHHRSGVFGLFDGQTEGSNFLGFGLRYEF